MRQLLLLLLILLLAKCKSNEQQSASTAAGTDTSAAIAGQTELTESEESDDFGEGSARPHDIIDYQSARLDEFRAALETFSPVMEVLTLASEVMNKKDSIYYAQQSSESPDTENEHPTQQENEAYDAILNYKQIMKEGAVFEDQCPSLLSLSRNVDAEDSTSDYLEAPRPSAFLAKGDFFFLGGSPFINEIHPDEGAVFQDAAGKPEMRFSCNETENTSYLMNALYHSKKIPTNILFGPPLQSYHGGAHDVRGVGSLIHEFADRIPVFFLTEKGLLSAQLISIDLKLVPEGLGCVSDQPKIIFSYSGFLNSEQILGIYIPFSSAVPTTCVIEWSHPYVWNADLNGDGVADVAGVSGTFSGISSDVMEEMLWFVNVNGEWKIIDAGQALDCT